MKALIVLLLTLSPSWSLPVGDVDLKLLDHNHTDPDRTGKLHFSHNKFDLGDIGVDGTITGEEISIGHGVDISIEGSKKPTLLATAVFNIATFVIGENQYFDGMFSSQDSQEEVLSKLNEIKAIAKATQNGVNELLIAADFMDYQLHVLAGPHRKILGQFNQISKLIRLNANQKQWIGWAEEVVDRNAGTAWALFEINYQITSNNVIGYFKNKAADKAASLTRTVAGSIEDFFQLQVIIQMIGFKTLEKANKHLHDCSARNDDYKLMIERFNQQTKQFNKVDASMPATSYLQNHAFGESFSLLNVQYAHLHPVVADVGKVVTGVQLYQYGNRVAIRIKQGRLQEFGRIDSESWKDASGWGEDVNLDYIQIYEGDCHFIDLHTASVPDGHAIVGMSFYKKGNRLGVKVQAAYVDYLTGKVYPTQWILSPGWGVDYYNTEDNKYFVDTGVVETKPSGLLTAAALYLKGNMWMAIQVSDVFKPYAEGESCTKYPHVKMIGKFDCCDGYLYDEASQKCPGNGNGPIYETPDLDCTGSPAKPRTWTSWSNSNSGGYLNHAKECAEGTYVDQIGAREQNDFGIVNFNFKCSDGQHHTMNDNLNGFWDSPLACESGFRQLTGKEQGEYGIINMRAWCEGEETSQRANENVNGKWNGDLTCEANQQVVGFEAREQDGYGIINFRFLCA